MEVDEHDSLKVACANCNSTTRAFYTNTSYKWICKECYDKERQGQNKK